MITENNICLMDAIENLNVISHQLEWVRGMVLNDRPKTHIVNVLNEAIDVTVDLKDDIKALDLC